MTRPGSRWQTPGGSRAHRGYHATGRVAALRAGRGGRPATIATRWRSWASRSARSSGTTWRSVATAASRSSMAHRGGSTSSTSSPPRRRSSWTDRPTINPGPFQFHRDPACVRRWMAGRDYLFCRRGEVREIMRPIADPDGSARLGPVRRHPSRRPRVRPGLTTIAATGAARSRFDTGPARRLSSARLSVSSIPRFAQIPARLNRPCRRVGPSVSPHARPTRRHP